MSLSQDASFRRLVFSIALSALIVAAVRTLNFPTDTILTVSDFATTLFLNALSMSVLPLIFFSVISGATQFVEKARSPQSSWPILAVFAGNTFLGVSLATVSFNLSEKLSPSPVLAQASDLGVTRSYPFAKMILKIFPPNIFEALSSQNMIGMISFSLFFGTALGLLSRRHAARFQGVSSGIDALSQMSLKMVRFFISLLPYAVAFFVLSLGLTFKTENLESFSSFFMVFFGAIGLYWLVGLLILSLAAGKSPLSTLQMMKVPLLSAATTTSSAAALPDMISVLEKEFKVSSPLVRFVTPLGTILNMSCSALFICASVLHLAHLYGYPMMLSDQIALMLMSWIISWGIAGVPSGSLLSLIMLLQVLGIPKESLALILGFDRLFDILRSLSNVFGNGVSVLLLSHLVPSLKEESSRSAENP